jgi:hypothetical protein
LTARVLTEVKAQAREKIMKFRLLVTTEDGSGFDHSWGDSYEVEAENYAAARADVLGREGVPGSKPYTTVKRAWMKNDARGTWIGGEDL